MLLSREFHDRSISLCWQLTSPKLGLNFAFCLLSWHQQLDILRLWSDKKYSQLLHFIQAFNTQSSCSIVNCRVDISSNALIVSVLFLHHTHCLMILLEILQVTTLLLVSTVDAYRFYTKLLFSIKSKVISCATKCNLA